jgi:hypothetical protein
MNVLILFGVIEFIDDEAIVHSVSEARFMDAAETHATENNLDWIAPHYCKHRITFHQHAKETSWTAQ